MNIEWKENILGAKWPWDMYILFGITIEINNYHITIEANVEEMRQLLAWVDEAHALW